MPVLFGPALHRGPALLCGVVHVDGAPASGGLSVEKAGVLPDQGGEEVK